MGQPIKDKKCTEIEQISGMEFIYIPGGTYTICTDENVPKFILDPKGKYSFAYSMPKEDPFTFVGRCIYCYRIFSGTGFETSSQELNLFIS
jgi:hypothetical protein